MNDKKLFTLPKKPVDQYRVDYYYLSLDTSWVSITKITAIYHFNTSYKKATGETGGVPLVNTWLIFENDRPLGRNDIWKSMERHNTKCFLTREEAVLEATKRLNKSIAYMEANIVETKELLIHLKKEATKKP